jgi:hypothetical protein
MKLRFGWDAAREDEWLPDKLRFLDCDAVLGCGLNRRELAAANHENEWRTGHNTTPHRNGCYERDGAEQQQTDDDGRR